MKRLITLLLLLSAGALALSTTLATAQDLDGHQVSLRETDYGYELLFTDESGASKLVRFSPEDMADFRGEYEKAKKVTTGFSNGDQGEVAGPLLIDDCIVEFGGTYPKNATSKWVAIVVEGWSFHVPVRWWGKDSEKHSRAKADFDNLMRKARI